MMRLNPHQLKRGWWGLVLLLFTLAVIGCEPKARYQTLSLFFDGVPNPDAKSLQFQAKRGTKERPVYIHKPFAEKKCNSCHLNTEDIFARAKVRDNVCLECHAGVKSEYAVLHGPVAANACLMCHIPHQSTEEHLLKSAAPSLCMKCHESSGLSSNPPEHLDKKSNCIICHSGHGGPDRNFLKLAQGAGAGKAPATKPAGVQQ